MLEKVRADDTRIQLQQQQNNNNNNNTNTCNNNTNVNTTPISPPTSMANNISSSGGSYSNSTASALVTLLGNKNSLTKDRALNNNNNNNSLNNTVTRNNLRNSTDPSSSGSSPPPLSPDESADSVIPLNHAMLEILDGRHRRSLSENGLLFPHNTKPSDKARCHILRGSCIRENVPMVNPGSSLAETHNQPAAVSPQHPLDVKNCSPRVTFRKIAETMFLKDPQYKQQMEVPKRNPFTALAQLKGVKKIICGGGNGNTAYTAGLSNLFSSCFEMSSSALKGVNGANGGLDGSDGCAGNGDQTPKSLPNSPIRGRKDYGLFKVDKMTGNGCGAGGLELDTEDGVRLTGTGTLKKLKANSLFAHPLFKQQDEDEKSRPEKNGRDLSMVGENVGLNAAAAEEPSEPELVNNHNNNNHTVRGASCESTSSCSSSSNSNRKSDAKVSDESVKQAKPNVPMPERLMNRRGSTESGFFSCLNEEFGRPVAVTPSTCCCCSALEGLATTSPYGRSNLFLGGGSGVNSQMDAFNSSQTLNDSSGLLLLDEATSINRSFRSIDDLDGSAGGASGGRRGIPFYCSRHGFDGLGAMTGCVPGQRSASNNLLCNVDMDLINRLALDSEINHIMQQNQMSTNHLLFYKNRTSSIYTDSSDDISSLAGSDSLLWDSPRGGYSSSNIPNTRSAQIAKIVEYFERKGQTFKSPSFCVPESLKTTPTSSEFSTTASSCASSASSHYPLVMDLHRNLDATTPFDHPSFYRRTGGLKSRDYEAFCLDLDKRPAQQRLLICEGAVRSKLPLFDKQQKAGEKGQAHSPTGSGTAGGNQLGNTSTGNETK